MGKLIEQMYQQYLKKVKLDENKMPEVQKKETRRAFFGGASSTLAAVTDEVMDDVESGIDIIGSMIDESYEFWESKTNTSEVKCGIMGHNADIIMSGKCSECGSSERKIKEGSNGS